MLDATALFNEHYASVYRYVARLTGEPDVAADAAQEAFVRLLEKPPAAGQTRAWLFKVATNFAFEHARTRTRRARIAAGAPDRAPIGDAPLDPQEDLLRAEERRRVRTALDALSERDRTILLMREEGFSHKEIAAAVGTTTGSVGTLIVRALDKLSAQLDLDNPENET